MASIERRTFIKGLGASVALAPGVSLLAPGGAAAVPKAAQDLTRINPKLLIEAREAQAWHVAKDSMGGPTIAGSPSWKNFLDLCERELRERGVVDVFRNPWTYSRWSTSEWPDDSKWSLHVGGRKLRVASYGCNSGSTPEDGIVAPLVVYEEGMPAEALQGKIAVIVKPQAAEYVGLAAPARATETGGGGGIVRRGDYEYLSSRETFPNPEVPREEGGDLSPFGQMGLRSEQAALEAGGAVGAILVLGLSYQALAGTYTFPVPALYSIPTLYVDRDIGRLLVGAAGSKRSAVMRLIGETEEAETYQLFGYLPGRDYGTDEDEQILLVTHTDGPSISQDNGAFGILGMIDYFSQIPQAKRPRTLMVFLDCRHYMPGAERAFAAQDWAASHPDLYDRVIAAMGIEHLGQMQAAETAAKGYHLTDEAELSSLWVTQNQQLVDWAIEAVEDNRLERVQVQCPGRPGVHGGEQGPWYGLGNIARRLGIPGASTMGTMSAYWSSKARINAFDAEHFVRQVATMSQMCGRLMLAEVERIASADPSVNG